MKKIFEALKRGMRFVQREQDVSELSEPTVDWQNIEISHDTVARYFGKHAGEELDLPLAILRQVREKAMMQLVTEKTSDPMMLARLQGILQACDYGGKVYLRLLETAVRKRKAKGET